MEQSNMMPNGMPGQGNMANSMQRGQPGNINQQIHAKVLNDLRSKINELQGGWQAMFDIRERSNRIMQLITMLRQINSDVGRCMQTAEMWEEKMLKSATSKEHYVQEMEKKMREITGKRQQQANMMNLNANGASGPGGNINGMMQQGGNNNMNMNPQNLMMNPSNMQNLQNMQGMQNNMGFPNGMNMGMQNNAMNPATGQNQMFPAQLQRQMQPSPLPLQQQNNTLDPSALQITGQQQQPQPPQMGQPGQSQQFRQPNGNQNPQQPNTKVVQHVMALAREKYNKVPDEQKASMRTQWLATLPEHQRANVISGTGDPLLKYFYSKAQQEFAAKHRQQQMANAQQNNSGMQQGTNGNVQMGNNVPARPPSQTGGQNIDFSSIMGQRDNALKLQESGEQVVPASNNNNMGMGNQMGMPQNINPQMLGNQNNQGGQGNNQQNFQHMLLMQQNARQRESMQKQLMGAANANRQQQQLQLHGQPGGLHTPNSFTGGGNNGPASSPAMPMLNRPIVPPGQGTPGTPQPNRQQQPTPQTPMNNNTNQLMQQHQMMLNQNSQQQQQPQMNQAGQFNVNNPELQALLNRNPELKTMLLRVPDQHRAKLLEMPIAQMQHVLVRFNNQMMGGNQSFNQPGQPGQLGMPNMGMNSMSGNQQPAQNMMQQQMANAVPGFNSQPPQNQMAMDPQQMQAKINQQRQQVMIRNQAMDARPFPKQVLTHLGISAPATVQQWGDLKRHVAQSAATMPPQTLEKLQQQQTEIFKQNPQELQNAIQAFVQQQRLQQQRLRQGAGQGMPQGQQPQPQQPQPNGAPQIPTTMGVGPAPPAQMVVPPAPMMQNPNQGMQFGPGQGQQNTPPIPPPGPQEIQAFRSRVPQASQLNDDQIRQVIIRNKIQRFREQQQQRQNLQTAQLQRSGAQGGGMPNATQAGQQVPQHPPNQPAATQQKPPPSANNDVIEISSQAAQQQPPRQALQAPNMQATLSQGQTPALPPGYLQDQEQQKKVMAHLRTQQALRQAQGQVGAAGMQGPPQGLGPKAMSAEERARLAVLEQEVVAANPRGTTAANVDAAGFERAKGLLKKMWRPLQQIHTTYSYALWLGFDDRMIRDVMRAKVIVQQNVIDDSGNVTDFLSATPEQLQDQERILSIYMSKLKQRKEQIEIASKQAQGKGAPAPGKPQAPGMVPTTSQQGHIWKPSTNKAPPAPTENKTFNWDAAGAGVPKYDGRNELTPDKLKFPPQKKRKTDQPTSQASTPAASGASPAVASGKVHSPEQARKTQAQLKLDAEKEAEQKKFHCKDSTCEASMRGFDTESLLKQHEQAQHQPIDNALNYLLDNAATALGVDANGNAKEVQAAPPPAKTTIQPQTKPRIATARDLNKMDLNKTEQDQINRGLTPASVKEKIAKKQAEFDAAIKEAQKDMTLRDAMTQKLDMPTPDQPVVQEAAKTDEYAAYDIVSGPMDGIDDVDAWGSRPVTWERLGEQIQEGWCETDVEGVYNIIPGANPFDRDTWSSPELTPPGSDSSQSSRTSDVSSNDNVNFMISMQNMDADLFGEGGGGGVPESLAGIYDDIKDMHVSGSGEDVAMGDSEEKEDGSSEDEASKKRKAELDEADQLELAEWGPVIGEEWNEWFDLDNEIQA